MNGKKHWFYKMLLSYLPIFFILSSVLFLVFFVALSENIKGSTIKAMDIIGEQLDQSIENTLQPIDQAIIKEILIDPGIRQFYDEDEAVPYTIYQMNRKLNSHLAQFPIIDSLYMYRHADGLVVTDSAFIHIGEFTDRAFAIEQFNDRMLSSWSGRRMYADKKMPAPVEVVSLVRKVPFQTGGEGMFVVNIRVDELRQVVAGMSKLDISFVRMLDARGNVIFTTLNDRSEHENASHEELARIKSTYTGWEIATGVQPKYRFGLLSSFPYFWVGVGCLTILLGLVSIVYVTRRNYKPIETIVNRIGSVVDRSGGQDELRMIDMAVDKLMEQANTLQTQFEYDARRLRRHLFMELLEDGSPMDADDWRKEMRRLRLPDRFDRLMAAVMEIDRYPDFQRDYTEREQYLLKYVIRSAVHEMAAESGAALWTEWIGASQLGLLYFEQEPSEERGEQGDAPIAALAERATRWTGQNLKFSVTFGIGGGTAQISELPTLFGHALDALNHKPLVGSGRVIHHRELPDRPAGDMYAYMESIRTLVHHYRIGDGRWESDFAALMDEVRSGLATREDVLRVLHYLLYHLDQQMTLLSEPFSVSWRADGLPELADLLHRFETVEEFRGGALRILQSMQQQLLRTRDQGSYSRRMHEVRAYINEHYADPDVSLIHLSEKFNLSSRLLSKLFKEEFGEKFVDYLVRVRMEAAKRLLRETGDSVQDIAQQVGYVHSFSFIRVFKKEVGVTPGDFRK